MAYTRRHRQKRGSRTKSNTIRRKSRRFRGGGCGCDNSKSMWGGSNNLGPSPGLDQLPIRSYYDLNSYVNDPTAPSAIQSTRIQPNMMSGGRHRRHKSYRRKSGKRLMRGGGFLDNYSLLGTDAISGFGTIPGIFNSNDLLHGNFGSNPNPAVQPITTMFNTYNPQKI